MIRNKVGLGFVVLLCGAACIHGAPPPNVTDDFAKIVACVVANDSSWANIVVNCTGYTLAELEAAIQWLLADPQFAKDHPEALPPLQARLTDLRAEKAKRQ